MLSHPTMLRLNLVFHKVATVLGLIVFLLYINDVRISSSLRLFTDDCVLYRIIESDQDHTKLFTVGSQYDTRVLTVFANAI